MAIKSFADKETAAAFLGVAVKCYPAEIRKRLRSRLDQINAATSLDFLRIPPGNRLELLSGDRAGQYSIRINQQWRICFHWHTGDAYDVEITDYH